MKKTLSLLIVLALCCAGLHAQVTNVAPVVQPAINIVAKPAGTIYPFSGITAANLAATVALAITETPATAGQTLANLNVNKDPTTGLYNVTAVYR